MRVLRMAGVTLLSAGALVCVLAVPVAAQVCGDANGDGQVTDTDGVLALRAAAQLSSVCTAAACDVNGDGQITDTDGVLVLRKAAGLSITENCSGGGGTPTPTPSPTPGGNTAAVEQVVGDFLPFLTVLGVASDVTNVASANAQPAQDTDDCPGGGTRTKTVTILPPNVHIDLTACVFTDPQLGSFQFDGTVDYSPPTVAFNIETTDLNSTPNTVVTFKDSVTGQPRSGGGFTVNGGPILVSSSAGGFELTFDDFAVNGEGNPVSGTATAEDTPDSFEIDNILFTANGNGTANLLATFDDTTTASFVLNLETGDLTPA